MIQIKRGLTDSWKRLKRPLAAGQPGYDKNKNKLKIGDGETLWQELPYTGLSKEEVLSSEQNARARISLDKKEHAIITYGTEDPTDNTIGELYLQCYDAEPEVDYIVASGKTGIWQYQIWKSGLARCWGSVTLNTALENPVGNGTLFTNDADTVMESVVYPFTFENQDFGVNSPVETATLTAAENKIAWLASKAPNSITHSGVYTILSCDMQQSASYSIILDVKGRIDLENWQKN
jgi:hypothetical protein